VKYCRGLASQLGYSAMTFLGASSFGSLMGGLLARQNRSARCRAYLRLLQGGRRLVGLETTECPTRAQRAALAESVARGASHLYRRITGSHF
jgi:hypothetical protein